MQASTASSTSALSPRSGRDRPAAPRRTCPAQVRGSCLAPGSSFSQPDRAEWRRTEAAALRWPCTRRADVLTARPGVQRPGQRGVEHAQHQVGPPVPARIQFEARDTRKSTSQRRRCPRATRSTTAKRSRQPPCARIETNRLEWRQAGQTDEVGWAHVLVPSSVETRAVRAWQCRE